MVQVEENKRIATRQRVLKGAKLVSMNKWMVTDCTIRDLSETGARIICGDQMAVANEFRLFIPSENSVRDARVVWRRGELIGVIFTSAKSQAPVTKFNASAS
ncbi:MAG: PilZ domain-containing protein [Alphaproteobacteria bacterium]|nr:PilZ domain-containing protein [Alphaproteobacteria bacterium]